MPDRGRAGDERRDVVEARRAGEHRSFAAPGRGRRGAGVWSSRQRSCGRRPACECFGVDEGDGGCGSLYLRPGRAAGGGDRGRHEGAARPRSVHQQLLQREDGVRRRGRSCGPRLTLELEQVPDLVAALGKEKEGQRVFRVGFAAEGSDLAAKGLEKIKKKGLQAIVANDISRKDIGFGNDYNEGVMLFADGSREDLPRMTKREMADRILDLVRPRLKS